MRALRDWNHNGKDDWFDRRTDYYVYKQTYGKDEDISENSEPVSSRKREPDSSGFQNPDEFTEKASCFFVILRILNFIISPIVGFLIAVNVFKTYTSTGVLVIVWVISTVACYFILYLVIGLLMLIYDRSL